MNTKQVSSNHVVLFLALTACLCDFIYHLGIII